MPENLRLPGEPPSPEEGLLTEIRDVCRRLEDVLAALRLGRVIDAYEGVADVRADLKAVLKQPA